MPWLGAVDPLPHPPRRVAVAGTSGSGKTTVAARVASILAVPHVELDGLHHGPGWVPRPQFEADVRALADRPAWVTEWQYPAARPLLAERADLLVWLDLPRRVVMRQIVLRTVRRRVRREVLWNGNVEAPLHTVLTDPGHVVRWAWTSYPRTADQVRAAQQQHPGLVVVRLRSRREVRRWLDGPMRACAAAPGPASPAAGG